MNLFNNTEDSLAIGDPLNYSDLNNKTILQLCASSSTLTEAEQEIEDRDVFFNFMIYGILLNLIGIFGVFGNIISMVILSRPQMKSSINQLLIGLARCDIVLIITSILLFGLPSIYSATGCLFFYYYRVHPLIAPFVFPIAMISQTVSVYLTLIVTLERFVAVCFPLQARSLCTLGRARSYMGFVIIFSVLYNITRFWEVIVAGECTHNKYNVPIYYLNSSSLRQNEKYIKIYINWMYLIFMYFIPFGCLAVLNTAIYRQVRRANRERQRLSRLQEKEIGLATMLLCIVVVFLICNLCALVSNILEAFWGKTNNILVETGNLMVIINSSVNFVIYVIFGEKFKRLFFKIFFPNGMIFCRSGYGGRDSPDHLHEESFVSNNGNGNSDHQIAHYLNSSNKKFSKNNRRQARKLSNPLIQPASSPASCVHYPARESIASCDTESTNIL